MRSALFFRILSFSGSYWRLSISENADCLITLGGDGTIIRASRRIAGSGIPIAGVNLGHLGYLTAVSTKAEIPELLEKGDRRLTGPTMPPQGLYLNRVWYDGAVGNLFEDC